jgi:hypothetical protein
MRPPSSTKNLNAEIAGSRCRLAMAPPPCPYVYPIPQRVSEGRAMDKVAKVVGRDRRTIEKARAVRDGTTQKTPAAKKVRPGLSSLEYAVASVRAR